MQFEKKLKEYARLIVECGVNVRPGEIAVITCQVENFHFARMVEEEAYKAGAKEVVMCWRDDISSRMRYDYADMQVFENVPEWMQLYYNGYAQQKACFINIIGNDPEIFKGVDPAKQIAQARAREKSMKVFNQMSTASRFKWTVAAIATPVWAAKVYPDMEVHEAEAKLWENIFACVRVGSGRDIKELWMEHADKLAKRRNWLNEQQFESLHYQNSIGTDFTVGLVDNHRWEGGADTFRDNGENYFANMPTEEIFTMPHRLKAEGTLTASMPLVYNGNIIRNFKFVFHEGKVISYTAEEGKEMLDQLFSLDEGSLHLGEAALVPYPSPVTRQGILFYNTLFDENAACHFALGACYETNLEGGADMEEKELLAKGGNHSMNHVDFMVGTEDLRITGIKKNGEEVPVFVNGTWAASKEEDER